MIDFMMTLPSFPLSTLTIDDLVPKQTFPCTFVKHVLFSTIVEQAQAEITHPSGTRRGKSSHCDSNTRYCNSRFHDYNIASSSKCRTGNKSQRRARDSWTGRKRLAQPNWMCHRVRKE